MLKHIRRLTGKHRSFQLVSDLQIHFIRFDASRADGCSNIGQPHQSFSYTLLSASDGKAVISVVDQIWQDSSFRICVEAVAEMSFFEPVNEVQIRDESHLSWLAELCKPFTVQAIATLSKMLNIEPIILNTPWADGEEDF